MRNCGVAPAVLPSSSPEFKAVALFSAAGTNCPSSLLRNSGCMLFLAKAIACSGLSIGSEPTGVALKKAEISAGEVGASGDTVAVDAFTRMFVKRNVAVCPAAGAVNGMELNFNTLVAVPDPAALKALIPG